jgi:hypothetical protein
MKQLERIKRRQQQRCRLIAVREPFASQQSASAGDHRVKLANIYEQHKDLFKRLEEA